MKDEASKMDMQSVPSEQIYRRLQAVEARWEILFHAAPDPIIIGDEDGVLVCNPRFEEITGLSSEQIIGIPISSLPRCNTNSDNCESLVYHWYHPKREGKRFTWEFTNVLGNQIFLDMQIKFVEIEDNMLRFCIGRDITWETRLLQDQKIAISQIDKNIAQLAALNDEIRNPLTLISMSAGIEEGPYQQRILEGVRLINRIVDRLDQGFTESEKVRRFLRRTMDEFMPEIDKQDIT